MSETRRADSIRLERLERLFGLLLSKRALGPFERGRPMALFFGFGFFFSPQKYFKYFKYIVTQEHD
jgi:hypothetical protein